MVVIAEAVNEVKRKALLELEKAVAESEAKAGQLLATERAKMEVAVTEARKQAMEEMILTFNSQQESTEVVTSQSALGYLKLWRLYSHFMISMFN